MADLARFAEPIRLPGVFEQIRLIGGIRWLMVKNGLRRKHNVWDLVGMIWVGFFSGCLILGLAFAFFAGGYSFARNHFGMFALLFWGVFLWWQLFPMFVAGFGANFEFAKLLRFPMSRRAFYLLGLGYGFSDFAAISSCCWMLAMLIGAARGRPSLLPVLLPVVALFVLLNVTLERLIGSWLEKLMAKRRTRELFLGIFILSMVSLNFLNPALQRYGGGLKVLLPKYFPYLWWTPGSLASEAVRAAAFSQGRGLLVGLAGLCLWLVAVSALLWLRYSTQYSGEELSEAGAPGALRRRTKTRVDTGELPKFLAPQVAAVVVKEFRYLTRNGMAFLQLIIPPVMVFFFSLQFGPGSMLKEHSVKAQYFYPGMIAYLLLILLSPAYNAFAYEGKGIQTYFMAPIRFRDVLLGKNLFLGAMVLVELLLVFVVLAVRVGWPGTSSFLGSLLAGCFAVVGQLTIANWSSLSFPKKMEPGKMKGQRNSGTAVWIAFAVQILLGGICAAVLFAGSWAGPWVAPIAFLALTVAASAGYVSSLNALDRLAESKRETLIEELSK